MMPRDMHDIMYSICDALEHHVTSYTSRDIVAVCHMTFRVSRDMTSVKY